MTRAAAYPPPTGELPRRDEFRSPDATFGVPNTQHSYYVTRTTRALELACRGPLTSAELALELRVDMRTSRRLLGRLAADGVLRRLDGRPSRYIPGPRLIALAHRVTGESWPAEW